MNDETLPWLLSSLPGIGVSLTVAAVMFAWRSVPVEDRSWLDRPPLAFRLVWPLIRLLDRHTSPRHDQARARRLSAVLRRAGLEFTLTAGQFRAGQTIAAVLAATLAGLLLPAQPAPPHLALLALCGLAGYNLPRLWLAEQASARQADIVRVLPYCLDIITLSVEAGSHLTGGMMQAHARLPDSALRDELGRVLRDVRAGKTRADALTALGDRTGSVRMRQIISGIVQAERSGSSIGRLLRVQAEQLRSERFQRAERQALEAPVRLLLPLVLFIFPTTFLVLLFLVLSKAIQAGLVSSPLLLWAYHWPVGR